MKRPYSCVVIHHFGLLSYISLLPYFIYFCVIAIFCISVPVLFDNYKRHKKYKLYFFVYILVARKSFLIVMSHLPPPHPPPPIFTTPCRCKNQNTCGAESVQNKNEMNNLLNNAPPSYPGALIQFPAGEHAYMSTRNNNFSNRSQKGMLKVTPA